MVTIQTGIKQNRKNYKNFCYWLNGVDVTDQNLDQFTPFITGTSRIFIHKMPQVMVKLDKTMSDNFKSLIESGYTAVDGIQDTNVEFVDFEGGFNGQKFRNVSMASNDTDTITIRVYEQSGSPAREFIDTWVNAARDQKSGVAHYHGLFDGSDPLPYSERNHTAEFIYVVMDPTGRAIEYACLFAHAFPTKVPKSHLNYESRGRNNVTLDLEFAVTMYESPAINALAAYYMINSSVDYNYLNFSVGNGMVGFETPQKYGNDNTVTDPSSIAQISAKNTGMSNNSQISGMKKVGEINSYDYGGETTVTTFGDPDGVTSAAKDAQTNIAIGAYK